MRKPFLPLAEWFDYVTPTGAWGQGRWVMTMTKEITRIPIPSGTGLLEAEQLISRVTDEKLDGDIAAQVPTTFKQDIFADAWAAIALGTLCRLKPDSAAIAWGIGDKEKFSDRVFATTPPGLVSIFLAKDVRLDGNARTNLDITAAKTWIEYDRQGLLLGESHGATRTLVEFSDTRALALTALSPSHRKGTMSESVFRDFVLNARKQLEFWRNDSDPTGPLKDSPMGCLAEFIRELFENAYQHGRAPNSDRQLRFLRFRKIIDTKDRLRQRAGSHFDLLKQHVEKELEYDGPSGFLEVVVSDFGDGIVDHFLSSRAGRKYAEEPRRDVLQRLLYKNLSSKTHDTSAGLGILHALTAAQKLQAFVSVRTSEHWLAKSFNSGETATELDDVRPGQIGRVAGTHWQLLWKIPR